jgi:tetratricopeptide (TPR) repeat protein
MHRFRPIVHACALAGCASFAAAAQDPRPVRDPDRGLDADSRARLALVDASRDEWAAERWAADLDAHLDELAALWRDERLQEGLAKAAWLAPELRVARLFREAEPKADQPAWSSKRGLGGSDHRLATETLASALAEWRREFRGEARIEFELIGFSGDAPTLDARIRVVASGVAANARLQHNALWVATWQVGEGGATLARLRVEDFDAVTLRSGAAPTFVDVTESTFEDPELYRARFAPGLEHWRSVIASSLSPGALGHHGVAIGDVDGDGLEDLYLCRPGGLPNQLLRHTADHRLADVSALAGVDVLDYSSSALLADFDGDGDLDLVVATGVGLAFFANDGKARFERKLTIERSLATSLAAADCDADGDLDLYVCSYLSPYEKNGLPVPYHDANNGEPNVLLRNDGAWSFVDATAAFGLDENNRRFTFAAAFEDFDNDGDQDLYVANDFGRKNLYRNEGGRFRDVAPEFAAEDVSAGMGVDWGDVDGDGWMDAYTTNMWTPAGQRLTSLPSFRARSSPMVAQAYRDHAQGNTLLLNRAGRAFEDVADASGTACGRWGWGAIFLDFDGDGALDLFAPNGFVSGEREPDLDSYFWRQVVLRSPDVAGEPGEAYAAGWRAVNRLMRQGFAWNGGERNVAYWNRGARFSDVSVALGLDHADDSRAAARIDWEGDGDEDLVLTNRSAPMLRMLENRRSSDHAWIAFELRSDDPRRTTIGARVTVTTDDGRTLASTRRCGHGYLAQSSARLTFGLGGAGVARVTVRWPNGETEDFGAPTARGAHVLVRGAGESRPAAAATPRASTRPTPPRGARAEDTARTVLPTPLPLPRLALETVDGAPASLLGITPQGPQGTGAPLVLCLWSVAEPRSRAALERLVLGADALKAAGLAQVLALSVDTDADGRRRALATWSELAWPFARGFVGEEAASVLELVLATLHDDARGLFVPAAFLIDASGRLVATYEGAFEAQTLARDAALLALSPEARREASTPFPGRWLAPLPPALDGDVAARLSAHGLTRPASEYGLARVEVRKLSAANVEYELGVARHRQGRLPEAIEHFRRALAADPAHARAAQDLAVALHQKGDHAEALIAYKDALKLEPSHAQTRCNLGFLCLALRDVAGAERELAVLRTLDPALATQLESKLTAFRKD